MRKMALFENEVAETRKSLAAKAGFELVAVGKPESFDFAEARKEAA